VLEAALKIIEPRRSEWYQFDPVAYDAGDTPKAATEQTRDPDSKECMLVYLAEHQAKGPFVQMARRLHPS